MPALRRHALTRGRARARATALAVATVLVCCGSGACGQSSEAALAALRPAFSARRAALHALAARLPPVGRVAATALAPSARPAHGAAVGDVQILLASTLTDPDRVVGDDAGEEALAPLEGTLADCLRWTGPADPTPPAAAAQRHGDVVRQTCEAALAARDLVVVRAVAYRTGTASATRYRAGEATIEVMVADGAARRVRGATRVQARGPSRAIVERRRAAGLDVAALRELARDCLADNVRRAVLDAVGLSAVARTSSDRSIEQCAPDTALDDQVQDQAAADVSAPPDRAGGGVDRSELSRAGGALADQLGAHALAARERGLRPIAYFHAAWCAPCRAVARYERDPAMIEAFAGAAVIGVDIDIWGPDELRAAGLNVVGVPTWLALTPDGRPTDHTVTSAAWGDDVPANMAPVLLDFVRGQG